MYLLLLIIGLFGFGHFEVYFSSHLLSMCRLFFTLLFRQK